MDRVILVAAGGALGSVVRHQTGAWALDLLRPRPPRVGAVPVDVAGGGLAALFPFSISIPFAGLALARRRSA